MFKRHEMKLTEAKMHDYANMVDRIRSEPRYSSTSHSTAHPGPDDEGSRAAREAERKLQFYRARLNQQRKSIEEVQPEVVEEEVGMHHGTLYNRFSAKRSAAKDQKLSSVKEQDTQRKIEFERIQNEFNL